MENLDNPLVGAEYERQNRINPKATRDYIFNIATGFGRNNVLDCQNAANWITKSEDARQLIQDLYPEANESELWLLAYIDIRAADMAIFCIDHEVSKGLDAVRNREPITQIIDGYSQEKVDAGTPLLLFGIGMPQSVLTPAVKDRLHRGMGEQSRTLVAASLLDFASFKPFGKKYIGAIPEVLGLTAEQIAHAHFLQQTIAHTESDKRYSRMLLEKVLSSPDLASFYQQTFGDDWLEVLGGQDVLGIEAVDSFAKVVNDVPSNWQLLVQYVPNLEDILPATQRREVVLASFKANPRLPNQHAVAHITPSEVANFANILFRQQAEIPAPQSVYNSVQPSYVAQRLGLDPRPFRYAELKNLLETIVTCGETDTLRLASAQKALDQIDQISPELFDLVKRYTVLQNDSSWVVHVEVLRGAFGEDLEAERQYFAERRGRQKQVSKEMEAIKKQLNKIVLKTDKVQ